MKTIARIIISLLVSVSYALASGGSEIESQGILTTLFIIFGVFIVLFQLAPGLTLLSGMLKDMFSRDGQKALNIGSK